MISAKLKLIGVAPEAVSRLHKALEATFKLPDHLQFNTHGCPKDVPYAYIEESKYSTEHGTYTVSLTLDLVRSCGEKDERNNSSHNRPNYNVHLSAGSLQRIFQAVDQSLLPDSEDPVPANDETWEILRKREADQVRKKAEDEISALYETLLYKSLPCGIKNLNGREIVAANTDITSDHLRNIRHWNKSPKRSYEHTGEHVDLDSVLDGKVRAMLHKARELQEKLDKKSV
jgi:hypothetical protein